MKEVQLGLPVLQFTSLCWLFGCLDVAVVVRFSVFFLTSVSILISSSCANANDASTSTFAFLVGKDSPGQ